MIPLLTGSRQRALRLDSFCCFHRDGGRTQSPKKYQQDYDTLELALTEGRRGFVTLKAGHGTARAPAAAAAQVEMHRGRRGILLLPGQRP